MIRDLMDVHNAFMAMFEDTIAVDGMTVPARFFNPQPKLEQTPVYPEIIVQIFVPAPSSDVIQGFTQTVVGSNVEIQAAPKRLTFSYQVDLYSDRFDYAMKMYGSVYTLFPSYNMETWIEIDGELYDVRLTGVQSSSDNNEGVFQYTLTYEIDVPVYLTEPEVLKRIVTSPDEVVTVNTMEP